MLKVILVVIGAALLSGCAGSSVSDFGGENQLASDAPSADSEATGSVTPVSATTKVSSEQTSARASVAAITAVATPGNVAYKIGPQDVLEISVFKVAELSKSAQVSEAGTLNYPLVGEVVAAGKTARELEKELTTLLGAKYLQKPQVTVL